MPLLRCLDPDEANYTLREVHEGVCGNQAGGGQACPVGLLLAHYGARRRGIRSAMRLMPKVRHGNPSTVRAPHTDFSPLAFRPVGN